MKKNFIVGLLVTVAFAGLVLFTYSQTEAQMPVDTLRYLQCTNGDIGYAVLDPITGDITAAYYCPAASVTGPNQCSEWIQLTAKTAYVCDDPIAKNHCRLVIDSGFGAYCGTLGFVGGHKFW